MQQSVSLDELIDTWNRIKDMSMPTPCTVEDTLKFMEAKQNIVKTLLLLQTNRWANYDESEEALVKRLQEYILKFNKEYLFRILGHEQT